MDGFGSSGQPSGALITWEHQNANRLFYDSSNFMPLALSDQERADLVQACPPSLSLCSTLCQMPSMSSLLQPSMCLCSTGSAMIQVDCRQDPASGTTTYTVRQAFTPGLFACFRYLCQARSLNRSRGAGQAQGHSAHQHPHGQHARRRHRGPAPGAKAPATGAGGRVLPCGHPQHDPRGGPHPPHDLGPA